MSRRDGAPKPTPAPTVTKDLIDRLVQAAMSFTPPDRAMAMARKWLGPREPQGLSEHALMAMLADSILLSSDLALPQPPASGATAFDRLVRSLGRPAPAEAAALTALGEARFRLLRLQGDAGGDRIAVDDARTQTRLTIAVDDEFPALPSGAMLFARVAMLGAAHGVFAGAVTPLNVGACAAAQEHPAAFATGAAANNRWAEAVYCHVVRNGTLDVPGLNRPREGVDLDDFETDAEITLFALAMEWAELDGAAPDADLLQRTRQDADLPSIVAGLAAAAEARRAGEQDIAAGFSALLAVQLETILRRERGGSSRAGLDDLAGVLATAVSAGRLPKEAQTLFETLRARLVGTSASRPAGDPELERLVQRIQALRAKTVAQGCTEQEALAAAEKVAELLDRYGLSLGELDFRAQPCEGANIQTTRRRLGAVDQCVPAIAAFFDCRTWVEQAKGSPLRHVFFGLRGDVAAAQYLYEMVERAFDSETDAFRAGALYRDMGSDRRSATNSFQLGLARGITGKLRALQAARDSHRRSASGRDLVPMKAAIVEDELAKLGLDFTPRGQTGGRRVLSDAYAAGTAAGQRFEVVQGISRAA